MAFGNAVPIWKASCDNRRGKEIFFSEYLRQREYLGYFKIIWRVKLVSLDKWFYYSKIDSLVIARLTQFPITWNPNEGRNVFRFKRNGYFYLPVGLWNTHEIESNRTWFLSGKVDYKPPSILNILAISSHLIFLERFGV